MKQPCKGERADSLLSERRGGCTVLMCYPFLTLVCVSNSN